MVNVNSSLTNEDDIDNAITAIRRNGVALKGECNGSGITRLNNSEVDNGVIMKCSAVKADVFLKSQTQSFGVD